MGAKRHRAAAHTQLRSLASVRSLFPGAEKGPYFDTAARGLLYSGARAAIDGILDAQEDGTLDKKKAFDTMIR